MTGMRGRTAIVTGASSGIGRATAVALAAEGADVALLSLAGAGLDEAAKDVGQHGTPVRAIPVDVGDPGTVVAAFRQAAEIGTSMPSSTTRLLLSQQYQPRRSMTGRMPRSFEGSAR